MLRGKKLFYTAKTSLHNLILVVYISMDNIIHGISNIKEPSGPTLALVRMRAHQGVVYARCHKTLRTP